MKGLLVVLVLPSLASLSWRIPGPGLSNPIREITSRLFHMGQTMARMVGALSGNYPSPHYNHYQHYHHHLGRLRVKVKCWLNLLLLPQTMDWSTRSRNTTRLTSLLTIRNVERLTCHLHIVSKILVTSLTDLL